MFDDLKLELERRDTLNEEEMLEFQLIYEDQDIDDILDDEEEDFEEDDVELEELEESLELVMESRVTEEEFINMLDEDNLFSEDYDYFSEENDTFIDMYCEEIDRDLYHAGLYTLSESELFDEDDDYYFFSEDEDLLDDEDEDEFFNEESFGDDIFDMYVESVTGEDEDDFFDDFSY